MAERIEYAEARLAVLQVLETHRLTASEQIALLLDIAASMARRSARPPRPVASAKHPDGTFRGDRGDLPV